MKGLKYINPQLSDYELIDCGNFAKLERFGQHIVQRPEPQALWQPSLSADEWQELADATFQRDAKSDERGSWQLLKGMPERWTMEHASGSLKLRLRLALTGFKHVGVFPEQAENWDFIYEQVHRKAASGSLSYETDPRSGRHSGKARDGFGEGAYTDVRDRAERERNAASGSLSPRVLNLFAYTGGATLAARAAGAEVTHVDSVKQTVNWAHDNLTLSQLGDDGVRWIVDDAMKFVRREVRRGNRYDGIILDPPAYGRGPEGEKWVLEQGLDEMLYLCSQLLDDKGFMVLNLYSMGVSAMVARTAVHTRFGVPENEQFGELFLTDRAGKNLPLGVYYRLTRG